MNLRFKIGETAYILKEGREARISLEKVERISICSDEIVIHTSQDRYLQKACFKSICEAIEELKKTEEEKNLLIYSLTETNQFQPFEDNVI
jgi:hypothetical protein